VEDHSNGLWTLLGEPGIEDHQQGPSADPLRRSSLTPATPRSRPIGSPSKARWP